MCRHALEPWSLLSLAALGDQEDLKIHPGAGQPLVGVYNVQFTNNIRLSRSALMLFPGGFPLSAMLCSGALVR